MSDAFPNNWRPRVTTTVTMGYEPTPERLLPGSDLDHWVWTAGDLANVRDALTAATDQNRRLRLALFIAMRVLGAEEVKACMTTPQRAATEQVEQYCMEERIVAG